MIDTAIAKKLPMIAGDLEDVAHGGLAGYAESYRAIGRLLAKYVERVLLGAAPAGLPIEQLDRIQLVINLKTARAIGLTVPPAVLARADEVIQ